MAAEDWGWTKEWGGEKSRRELDLEKAALERGEGQPLTQEAKDEQWCTTIAVPAGNTT